jgi:hypothetical protein
MATSEQLIDITSSIIISKNHKLVGFSLPKIIVSFYTKLTMKKYLAVLKKNVEG